MKRRALSVLALALLAGCFTIPMSPDEYRAAIRNHKSGNVETFEVKRPIAEVARSFKRKAEECLSYDLAETKTPTIGFGSSTRVYAKAKPTVLHSGPNAELHFQVKSVGNLAKEPPGGNYYLVADAKAVGKDKTKVEIYSYGMKAVAGAIRGWAHGDEKGCPDPMRTFER